MDTTSLGTSANWRNGIPHLCHHHLNPPSLDSKITRKRKALEEHKSAPGDKGMQTQAQVPEKMDYSFFALNSLLCLQCIKEFLYSFSKG